MIYKVKWYINEDSTKEFFVEARNLKEAKAIVYCQFAKFPSMLGNCLEFERVIEKKKKK